MESIEKVYKSIGIRNSIINIAEECEAGLGSMFKEVDRVALINTAKVLNAFKEYKVSDTHFKSTTGYGYDDLGREVIEKVYAKIFDTEDALVRIQFVNGTHALSTALMGNLKCGDTLLSITGAPYDTLAETIGLTQNKQSLISNGVKYLQIDLVNDVFDYEKIIKALRENTVNMVFIGRSRGYSTRKSLTVSEIAEVIKKIKEIDSNIAVMVDNCYGEFVEEFEPTNVGADIMAGSLIKNLGGGICETGGYIVGRKDLIESAAERLTAPGIGKECGATLDKNREILQGLFIAPQSVKNAVKVALLVASIFEKLGYKVNPSSTATRTDIIQSVKLNNEQELIKLIQGIQSASPIDSFVIPLPWDMPGYSDKVIMAAGTFISGASIELSADAPIKAPYLAYVQGGITYESGKIAIMKAISDVVGE